MSSGEFPRSPLLGLPIEIVQPGTVIAHAETGHEMTVDHTCAAISGGKVYMTRRVYELVSNECGEGRMAQ